MRIVAGKLRHRKITFPKNLPVRATTDMAKEAIFNILHSQYFFEDLDVLDLFAGSGAISYEFASRDANQITAVDNHPLCASFIRKTMTDLGVTQAQVFQNDAFHFLEKCGQSYDIVFADPPYGFAMPQYNKLIALIFEKAILQDENALFILEHSKELDIKAFLREPFQTKTYGSVKFSMFRKE